MKALLTALVLGVFLVSTAVRANEHEKKAEGAPAAMEAAPEHKDGEHKEEHKAEHKKKATKKAKKEKKEEAAQ